MKVLAYYPIHYGIEYLNASIKSIEKYVDKIIIIYSKWPSFSYGTERECPEKESDIRDIALSSSPKVEWISLTKRPICEAEHRDKIFNYCEGYDLILACDADEVWDEKYLYSCIRKAQENKHIRNFGISGYLNFWKSFNTYCADGFTPIRIISLQGDNKKNETMVLEGKVYHFSCAQSDAIMRYKYEIHGHKNEIRKDWLENTYFNWKEGQGDLHCVSIGLWNPIHFDKDNLPDILKSHSNFNKDIIK